MTRICYVCKKEIKDVEGKYFCSRVCWEEYGGGFKSIANRPTVKEMQERVREFGKGRSVSIVDEARRIFE